MELFQLVDKVHDAASFIDFAEALLEERRKDIELAKKTKQKLLATTPLGWQNSTLEGFLSGAINWAKDSDFEKDEIPQENPWRKFANFLYCGTIYE